MPVLQRLRDLLRTSSTALSGGDPFGFLLAARQAPPSRFAINYLNAYSEMPWLRAVMHRLATAVATQPWVLYQQTRTGRARQRAFPGGSAKAQRDVAVQRAVQQEEWEEVQTHPLLDLLSFGNGMLDGMTVRILTQLHLDLVGEAFWIVEPDESGRGTVQGLWPVPPPWVVDIPLASRPTYQVRFPTGQTFDLPPESIVHLRQSDPADPYRRGKGVTQSLADELDIDEYAAKFTRQWFFNSSRPDVLITGDGLGEAAMRGIEERWERKTRGFLNAFKPLFLSKKVDVHQLQSSLKDMDLSSLRASERDVIVSVTGVPPEILGILASSNRSTIDASSLHFARYSVLPRLELLRTIYNRTLVPLYGPGLFLEYVSPVPDDQEFRLKVYAAAPQAFTVDEWRALTQDTPLPDGQGQVRYGPLNLVAMDVVEGSAAEGAASLRSLPEAQALPELPVRSKTAEDEQAARLLHRLADHVEPQVRRAFLAAVTQLQGSLDLDLLVAALVNGSLDTVLGLIPWANLETGLADVLQQALKVVEQSGVLAATALADIGISLSFSLDSPEALAYAKAKAGTFIAEITEETRLAVRSLIEEGVAQGLPTRVLVERIQDFVGLNDRQTRAVERFREQLVADRVDAAQVARRVRRYRDALLDLRAETIARTELMEAANRGHQLAWEQAMREGVLRSEDWRKRWILTADDRLCPLCEGADVAPENQDVPIVGRFTLRDGSQHLSPPGHVACRCVQILARLNR